MSLLSSTADIIFVFFIKKILIYAQNQETRKNFPLSSKGLWPFISKISAMYKNFKSKPMIRESSLKIMPQAIRYG